MPPIGRDGLRHPDILRGSIAAMQIGARTGHLAAPLFTALALGLFARFPPLLARLFSLLFSLAAERLVTSTWRGVGMPMARKSRPIKTKGCARSRSPIHRQNRRTCSRQMSPSLTRLPPCADRFPPAP